MEIKIWEYENAPEEYRFVYDDVNWIAFVPDSMSYIWDISFSNTYFEIVSRRVEGGTVYIQTH